jgi:hypothetical protein
MAEKLEISRVVDNHLVVPAAFTALAEGDFVDVGATIDVAMPGNAGIFVQTYTLMTVN